MTTTSQPQSPSGSSRVLSIAGVSLTLISLALLGMVGRVVQLQLFPERQLKEYDVRVASRSPLIARRGALLDCRRRPLAVTRMGNRLYADPKIIENWGDFAVRVGQATGDNPIEIERTLERAADRRYVVLDELLEQSQQQVIQGLALPGLALEPKPVRLYPQGRMASQLIGFVGRDDHGLDGLEYALESVLSAKSGSVWMLRDVRRHPLWIEREGFRPPQDGVDVRLSIDSVIQKIAEEELDAVCRKHRADRGEIVVMEARTGQMLAMANWPEFDTSKPTGRRADKARRNRCVTDPFEPGSIFKPFVHAAASTAGIVNVDTLIDTEGGSWTTSFGRHLHDAHAHGTITWGKVLILSSNIGMGKIGERLGAKRMHEAVKGFGFGDQSGSGLPGESAGIVIPLKKWTKYSVTSVPMGQEVAVTPVQLVRGFSAFANGGLVVSPSILAHEAETPIYQKAIDPKAAEQTKQLLRKAVTEGTGKNALSERYQIWGKTGTAQVPDRKRGGYKPQAYTASFICAAPLKDPQIIVLVTVHEPDPKIAHYGGVVSAPPAKNVVERTLTYLGVAPDVIDTAPHRLNGVQTASASAKD